MDRRQDDEAPHVADVDPRDDGVTPTSRRRWLISGAVVVVVVLAAAGIAFAVGGSDDDDGQRVTAGRAMLAVRAALDATLESGGYEIRFETESTGTAVGTQTVEGHGTLNVAPYALTTVADVSHLGSIIVRTDGVNLWEHGGGQYGLAPDGTEGPGQSLAGFADLVESTIGKGPGAVSMLNLASPTGYLALASPTVSSATSAGTGTVDGAPVTYYAAEVDLRRLADLPGLGAEQRRTIADATESLASAGYDGTDVRIAIDASGYVVETTASTVFGDGARFRTHTVLSHFGCVGRVRMPGGAATPPPAISDGCTAPPSDVSSTTVSSTTTTLPAVTTTVVGGMTSSTTTSTTTTTPGASTAPLTRDGG
jgi:hypothetical protein